MPATLKANGTFIAVLIAMFALLAVAFKLDGDQGGDKSAGTAARQPAPAGRINASAPAADAPSARGVGFEPYRRPDPTLPAVPPGRVKRFRVDVLEHVTKVAPDKAPVRVWSYGVNGTFHRGTGVSPPIVVNQGDRVEITLVNGASKRMGVTLPHSIDLHAAEVAPDEAFRDVAPGRSFRFRFAANHPGVFMYHCATQPVLMHSGAGMAGMIVVRPRGLQPAKELWLTQQEYYIGKPGADPSMAKMEAKTPDVIAFNGYAAQYRDRPIRVRRGERVRIYVLNAGPSIWSGFHVIGTVFDRTVVEGALGHDAQTVNLAPSQGGWVEFTLDREGTFPFVTHAFGDMVRGAAGALTTERAAGPAEQGAARTPSPTARPAPGGRTIQVELGEMYVRPSRASVPAGKVTFAVRNVGRIPHELMVERMPIELEAPGEPDEGAAMHVMHEAMPMHGGRKALILEPGRYELFCNLPGHYAAGQRKVLTVTKPA